MCLIRLKLQNIARTDLGASIWMLGLDHLGLLVSIVAVAPMVLYRAKTFIFEHCFIFNRPNEMIILLLIAVY